MKSLFELLYSEFNVGDFVIFSEVDINSPHYVWRVDTLAEENKLVLNCYFYVDGRVKAYPGLCLVKAYEDQLTKVPEPLIDWF